MTTTTYPNASSYETSQHRIAGENGQYFSYQALKTVSVTVQMDNGLVVQVAKTSEGINVFTHDKALQHLVDLLFTDTKGARKQLKKLEKLSIDNIKWEANQAQPEAQPEPEVKTMTIDKNDMNTVDLIEHEASNSATYAYVRVSTKGQVFDSQETEILAAYPNALITKEKTSGTIPALEREGLGTLIKHTLRTGDTLVVWWIDRLGRDYSDVTETMRSLIKAGISIKTINGNKTFNNSEANRVMTDIMITLYADQAANERANRLASAEAGRKALKQNPEKWAEKFKGRTANEEQYKAIVEELVLGNSIRKIAAKLEVGISTVQRAKKRYAAALEGGE